MSWFIGDSAYILAKYITKVKEDVPATKDRGGPGIYEEMIKTCGYYMRWSKFYIYLVLIQE